MKQQIEFKGDLNKIWDCPTGYCFRVVFEFSYRPYAFSSPYDDDGETEDYLTSDATNIDEAIADITYQIEKRSEDFSMKSGWNWSAEFTFDCYNGTPFKQEEN